MDKTFKVVVAGSRSFRDYSFLVKKMDSVLSNKKAEGYSIVIIPGTAGGADTLGERYAHDRKYEVIRKPADWNTHKKAAGMIRNKEMLDIADAVVVFWDGESKGSKQMIDITKESGKPHVVFTFSAVKEEKISTEDFDFVGYFDGACKDNGNGGLGGIGAVIYDSQGDERLTDTEYIGTATNNEAEYIALIRLLTSLLQKTSYEILICGDSQLIIYQVTGKWKCNQPHLQKLLDKVTVLSKQFENLKFQWVRREENTVADKLSKEGLERGV